MKEYKYSDLFMQDSIDKQLIIEFDGGTITNEDLHSEQFELQESICSEVQLAFGSCETSQIKFRVSNIFNLPKGTWLKVSMILNGNADDPFVFGRYKVDTSTPTADRSFRDVVAYDSMNDIINADVAEWYNGLSFPMTLKSFRDKFFSHMGIIQQEISLINDNMVIEKTIEPSVLSGRDVCVSICQINGCFGHIGSDGKFYYVFLEKSIQALYPANDLYPSEDLYPRESKATKILNSTYIDCKYEDYIFKKITKLQIRKEENDVGASSGTEGNTYVIENNFLVYGKSASDLQKICDNAYSVISEISYRPFECTAKGNPCLVVGEPVRIVTKYQVIESYILKRNLKGIQSLKDSYYADGEDIYSEKVNSVKSSIVELRGKTNVLERTVEETRSEIKDVEQGLSSRITQNAEGIESEVTRAQGAEQQLSSSITQTAQSISTKVEKGEVISEINQSAEEVKIKASKISLEGTVTANGNVTIGTDGSLTAKNGSFEGTVNATSLVAKDKISLYAPVIGIPGTLPKAVMTIEDGLDYGTTGGVLSLYDYTKIGNLIFGGFSGNEINGNPVAIKSTGTQLSLSNNGGQIIFNNGSANSFRPQADYIDSINLGTSSAYWNAIYSKDGSIGKSDRNMKHDIYELSDKYERLFFELKPCSYVFNDGVRTHIGAISQDVEEALAKVGLAAEEFAGFCKDQKTIDVIDENGNITEELAFDEYGNPLYIYSLRYSEFIMLNTHMIQKAFRRIDELENKITEQQSEIDFLKESVSFLMEKLGGNYSE